mmetsp:Transcript_42387/g.130850  ORF Transcript_42387/g.130850 Transcript_42387/m.130850 type:complete len:316 (-) Transcript_42387:80-1027(-)
MGHDVPRRGVVRVVVGGVVRVLRGVHRGVRVRLFLFFGIAVVVGAVALVDRHGLRGVPADPRLGPARAPEDEVLGARRGVHAVVAPARLPVRLRDLRAQLARGVEQLGVGAEHARALARRLRGRHLVGLETQEHRELLVAVQARLVAAQVAQARVRALARGAQRRRRREVERFHVDAQDEAPAAVVQPLVVADDVGHRRERVHRLVVHAVGRHDPHVGRGGLGAQGAGHENACVVHRGEAVVAVRDGDVPVGAVVDEGEALRRWGRARGAVVVVVRAVGAVQKGVVVGGGGVVGVVVHCLIRGFTSMLSRDGVCV